MSLTLTACAMPSTIAVPSLAGPSGGMEPTPIAVALFTAAAPSAVALLSAFAPIAVPLMAAIMALAAVPLLTASL